MALIPLALKGVKYEPKAAEILLRNNLLIYGVVDWTPNVYITLVARSVPTFPSWPVRPRTRPPTGSTAPGANEVVSPYVTSGRRMANVAIRPHVVDFFDIARAGQPDLRLEELVITAGSPLDGRARADRPRRAVAGTAPRRPTARQPGSRPAPGRRGRSRGVRGGQRLGPLD